MVYFRKFIYMEVYSVKMTKFPNQEGLNRALNIYRTAMRSFIVRCLEQDHPKGVENLIVNSLTKNAAEKFEQDLQLYKGNIEASIHINTFPHIIRNRWNDVFEKQFDLYSNVRNVISLIADGRNQCAHLDTEDLNLDYTWTYLFLISDVLGQINRPDAKRDIETILDELFPDDTDERIADMTKQLKAVKAEKTELEKQVKTTSDRLEEVEAEWIACDKRLETISTRLKIAVAGKTVAEERLSDISNRLEETEVEKTELEKRLKTLSDRLKDVEKENAAYQKRVETIPKPKTAEKFREANGLEDRKEIGRQVAKLRINAAGSKPMSWRRIREKLGLKSNEFHKVIRLEDHFKESVVERIESFEKGWECSGKLEVLLGFEPVGELANRIEACKPQPAPKLKDVNEELAGCEELLAQLEKEPLPLNPNTPDSVTFQGTTFTRHLNEYHVTEDDISQSFWHYWHSQGREGKQEMRDAGWSVEKVNGEWEVTVSPEDFRSWIKDEVTELNSLLDFSRDKEPSTQPIRPSYERTSLPPVRKMVQPALELLSDGREHRRVEIINLLTEHFVLTDDQRSYLSKTGQAEKHLMNKGLIERTRTGYYRITTLGLLSSGMNS